MATFSPFFRSLDARHQYQAMVLGAQKARWERVWTTVAVDYISDLTSAILRRVSRGCTEAFINLNVIMYRQEHRVIANFMMNFWRQLKLFQGYTFEYLNNFKRTVKISWNQSNSTNNKKPVNVDDLKEGTTVYDLLSHSNNETKESVHELLDSSSSSDSEDIEDKESEFIDDLLDSSSADEDSDGILTTYGE